MSHYVSHQHSLITLSQSHQKLSLQFSSEMMAFWVTEMMFVVLPYREYRDLSDDCKYVTPKQP